MSKTAQVKLEAEVAEFKDKFLRSQADYQNLIRRQQEERLRLIKMAAAEVIEPLLQPLDHLSLAAAQLNDSGLNMVVNQFIQVIKEAGVTEVATVGQTYDPKTMEAVDGSDPEGSEIAEVRRQGYLLNGELLRPALVIVK